MTQQHLMCWTQHHQSIHASKKASSALHRVPKASVHYVHPLRSCKISSSAPVLLSCSLSSLWLSLYQIYPPKLPCPALHLIFFLLRLFQLALSCNTHLAPQQKREYRDQVCLYFKNGQLAPSSSMSQKFTTYHHWFLYHLSNTRFQGAWRNKEWDSLDTVSNQHRAQPQFGDANHPREAHEEQLHTYRTEAGIQKCKEYILTSRMLKNVACKRHVNADQQAELLSHVA